MAEEFKILLGAELKQSELDSIKSQIDRLQTNPIDLTINQRGIQTQINAIRSQIQSLDGTTINVNVNANWNNWNNNGGGGNGGGNGRNGNGIRRIVTEANDAYRDLTNLARRINSIRIQIGGLDANKSGSQITELRTQLRALINEYNNTFANFTQGMDFQGLNVLENNINQVQHQLTQLRRTEEELSLQGIDTTQMQGQIQALENQLSGLLQTYRNLANGLDANQLNNLTTTFDETTQKVAVLEAKLNDIAQKISNNFANGDYTNQFDKIQTSFDNIINKSDATQIAFQEFNNAFNDLQIAINNNDMDAIINANQRYEESLKSVKNQLDINARAEKQSLDIAKLENRRNSLSSSMDIWLKNNSAAVKQFGARINELKIRLQNCDAVELNNLQAEFREIQKEAKLAGVATQSFGDKLKKKFSDVGSYLSAATIIAQSAQAIRTMYNNVVLVDTAMTGLYRVTDLTSQQYSDLYSQMISSAKEYGATLDNIINATSDWVRAGFDANTSVGLAEVTTMYQHISDLDYDTAAENLITAYNGFKDELTGLYDGDEVAAVQYIADIFNELDNNFAVTSAGLGDALARSASALDVAGNSIQESAAMITGITEVTQDPEKAGSALKILSLRLRGMKGQLQELGEEVDENVESVSKMQTQILNLTGGEVNIFNDDGSFKSTYEIMQDIADIWDDLNSTDQADLLETIAGKNRANDVAALLSNWQNVEEAMKSAMEAEGSAAAENEKYMDSIKGRLDALTASWQAFSNTVVDSDFVKGLISGLTDFVDFLDKAIEKAGVFNTALAAISVGKIIKNITSVSKAAGGLSSLSDAASLLSLAFPNAAKGISIFTSALSNSTSVIGILKAAISGLWTVLSAHPIIAVIGAIGLAVAAFDKFHLSAKEANEKMAEAFGAYDDAKQKVINVNTELENTKTKIDELLRKESLTFVEQTELDKLKEATELLQIQADLAAKEEQKAAKEAAEAAIKSYNKDFKHEISQEATDEYVQNAEWSGNNLFLIQDEKNISAMIAGIRQMEKLRDEAQKLRDEAEFGSDEWNFANEDLERYNGLIDDATNSIWEQTSVLVDYKKKLESIPAEELTIDQNNALKAINASIEYIYQELDPAKWKQMQFDNIFNDKSFADARKELVKMAAANKAVGITVDDVKDKYPELVQAVEDAGFTIEDLINNIHSEAGIVNVDETVRQAKEKLEETMSDTTEGIETDATLNVEVEAEVKEASLSEVNEWLDSLSNEDKIIACDIVFNNDTSGWSLDTFKNKLAEAKKSIEESIEPISFSTLMNNEDFNNTVDSYMEKVEALKETYESLQSGDFSESDFIELSKIFPELADNADDLDTAILELLDTMNTDMVSYFNDQFGNLDTEEDVAALENFMNAVLKLGEVVGNTTFSIDVETEGMKNLWAAMKESVSSTGLTTESIKALKARYQDLENYDAARLFERTANGVHLNTKELRKLESAYEKQKKQNIDESLQNLIDQYDDLTTQIDNTSDTATRATLYAKRDDILNQINDTANLAAQYEGLTSAFYKWEQAQSIGEEGDMYDSLAGGLENIKELYDEGLIGTNKFRTAVQLMSNEDLSNASIEELLAAYDSGYSKMTRYFTDSSDGCLNFLNDVQKLNSEWVHMNDDGSWDIDFGVGEDQDIADALGINVESIQAILRKLLDYGFDINLDSAYTSLEGFQTRIEETESKLKELEQNPINIDVNAKDVESELENAKTIIQEIKNSDVKPEVKTAQLDDAYAKVDALISRINQPAFMSINVSDVDDTAIQEALALLQNYQTAVNNLKSLEIKGADTTEIETAKQKVDEYATSVNALPEDVKTKIGIDPTSTTEDIKALIAKDKITIPLASDPNNVSQIVGEVQAGVDNSGVQITVPVVADTIEAVREISGMQTAIDSRGFEITVPVIADTVPAAREITALKTSIEGSDFEIEIPVVVDTTKVFEDIGSIPTQINEGGFQLNVPVVYDDGGKTPFSNNNVNGDNGNNSEIEISIVGNTTKIDTDIDNLQNEIKEIEIPIIGDTTQIYDDIDAIQTEVDNNGTEIKVPVSGDTEQIMTDVNEVQTDVTSDGTQVEIPIVGDSTQIKLDIDGIEGKDISVNIISSENKAIEDLKTTIDSIQDKNVTITSSVVGKDFVDDLKTSIDGVNTKEVNVTAEVDGEKAVNKLTKAINRVYSKTVQVIADVMGLNKTEALKTAIDALYSRTVYVTAKVSGSANSQGTTNREFGGGSSRGGGGGRNIPTSQHALVEGTAYKHGDWGTKDSGVALVGELGMETLVRDGRFYTIGDDGAEFIKYQKNDIIFNHKQTEELFKNGKVLSGGGRGKVFANGTAFAEGNAFSSGSGSIRVSGSVITKSSSKNKSEASKKNKKESKEDDFEETFDWIEVAIDRIERAIDNLDLKANSVYRSWSDRNNALKDELSEITGEIDIQQRGYERYMKEANSVGLSESWAELVRNGAIDIDTVHDEELAEKIGLYREWYEKALDCQYAVDELKESQSELYQQAFDNIVTQYEGFLSVIEHERNMLEEYISQSEASGYIVSTKYYEALINVEKANIAKLEEEKNALLTSLEEAVNSGTIQPDSEAWFEMVGQIDEVTIAIEEANTSLIEFNNSIRDIEWEIFDLLQEQISYITTEADFLINLLSNDKLYDDRGQLTDEGMSTMGLHGMNYNTYMAQADKYAEEMLEINKQLAEDPYNQDLLNRRQELLELQQESILAAESEKQAIVDMVEEGINLELEALQELIDTYTEALDAQKDLYDYQKKVKEQTEEIASLEKQLSAYAGDTSEETKSKIQEIKVSLEKARENLEETEYDQYISDQKKLLDELYIEYETILNMRLDNIEALISDMILEINTNASTINATLSTKADEVGYTLSDSMKNIWDTSTNSITTVLTTYGQGIQDGVTTLNTTISTLSTNIQNMVSSINSSASSNVSSGTVSSAVYSSQAQSEIYDASTAINASASSSSSSKSSSSSSSKSNSSSKKSNSSKKSSSSGSNKSDVDVISGADAKASSANVFDYKKDSYPKDKLDTENSVVDRLKYNNFDSSYSARSDYYKELGFSGTYTGSDKQNIQMLDYLKKNGYKNGKYKLSKDELAWTQEDKNLEAIIRPSDGAILTPLAQDDSILKPSATSNIFNFANDPNGFIRDNLNIGNSVTNVPSQSVVGNTYDNDFSMQVILPNVQNYEQFKHAMQHDKSFEKMVRAMTVDKMFGGSSLKKYKY